jgi:hypothetical protein
MTEYMPLSLDFQNGRDEAQTLFVARRYVPSSVRLGLPVDLQPRTSDDALYNIKSTLNQEHNILATTVRLP